MNRQYDQIDLGKLVGEEKKVIVRCPFTKCNARIILVNKSLYDNFQTVKNSPEMVQPQESSGEGKEDFLKINDVWDFDNIGVSRPSDDLKQPEIDSTTFKIERLLVCSECDRGPLGFAGHETEETDVNKLKYFLSCSSVVYNVE